MEENTCIWPGDAAKGEIEILHEEVIWSNPVAQLYNARVRFPARANGQSEEGEHFRLGHGAEKDDGVIVVPITPDNQIVLLRQFRHPIRMWIRELPRGARERGESPTDAVARETREETGYEVERIYPLGRIATDSGQLTDFPYLFAARVRPGGERQPESSESIDRLFRYSYTALKRACQLGAIIDACTLVAVTRLEPHFNGDRFQYRPEAAPEPAADA
jgi:ADP-ribose pyrophosphatase